MCTNDKCTFVHLKGTRRKKPDASPNNGENVPSTAPPSSSIPTQSKNMSPQVNDPLFRLEKMIIEIRKAQAEEMAEIRQELFQLRSQGPQVKWGAPPQWVPTPQPQFQYHPSVFNQYPMQNTLTAAPPPSVYPQLANRTPQQVKVPPGPGVPPSYC